jgi:hypothetical protein
VTVFVQSGFQFLELGNQLRKQQNHRFFPLSVGSSHFFQRRQMGLVHPSYQAFV